MARISPLGVEEGETLPQYSHYLCLNPILIRAVLLHLHSYPYRGYYLFLAMGDWEGGFITLTFLKIKICTHANYFPFFKPVYILTSHANYYNVALYLENR